LTGGDEEEGEKEKGRGSFTLTPNLSPQGRGGLEGGYPFRERKIRV
jgi:hypothetical protein